MAYKREEHIRIPVDGLGNFPFHNEFVDSTTVSSYFLQDIDLYIAVPDWKNRCPQNPELALLKMIDFSRLYF